MSMRRTLDRNRQMKKIAQSVMQKWEKATIHAIDGNRVHLRLGNAPNLIRHVEVAGDVSALAPGQIVPIIWKDNRPVVVQGAASTLPAAIEAVSGGAEIETVKVHMSTTVSVATAGTVILTFDTVLVDTGGYFDTSTPDQVTVWASGLYLAIGTIPWGAAATYLRRARILVNDDEEARGAVVGSGTGAVEATAVAILLLQAGDKVQLEAYQNSGAAVATTVFADESPALTLMRLK